MKDSTTERLTETPTETPAATPVGETTGANTLLSRRTFLGGVSAGSLILGWRLTSVPSQGAEEVIKVDGQAEDPLLLQPDLFVAIAPDGAVTILAHRSEMGSGIRTALPMVVADELGADWNRIVIRQAVADGRLGSQNTDGSCSITNFYQRMRIAGATARTMLEQAAAALWNVDPKACQAQNHQVVHATTDQAIGFGELVPHANLLPVPPQADLTFRPADERRYIGQDIPITDLDDVVTGKAIFGIDVRRPNQLFAVVARPPVLGGRVLKFDADAARNVAGVVDIVEIPRFSGPHVFQPVGGVAVVASSTWSAMQGRDKLAIEWDDGPHAVYDSDEFSQLLVESSQSEGKVFRSAGDVKKAFQQAEPESLHEADYYVPHLAHASMEPPCALCEVKFDAAGNTVACEAWASTQNPQAAQDLLATTLGIDKQQVTVHVTLLGAAFGRKSKPDYVAEAALLSRALKRPVHVTWSREDDIQNDYYHTVAAVHMKAAVDAAGRPTAWLQRSAFPSIATTWNMAARHGLESEMSQGFTDIPYLIENLQVENGAAEAHLRIGWLRSVAHIYHAFAVCSFPDELAARAGRDPYQYLLDLLGPDRQLTFDDSVDYKNRGKPLEQYPIDVGRLRHVTERAAALGDWGKSLPRGRGLGIACHRSFLSYCAHVVEVEVTPGGELKIPRISVVIDAGLVIHPDRVRAQLEGAAVFGASLARYGEITARRGRVEQSNFDDFEVARIDDSPQEIAVEIVPSEAPPGGVGEVGVPTFAPALCNAIFAATGKRIRRLPLSRHDLSWV